MADKKAEKEPKEADDPKAKSAGDKDSKGGAKEGEGGEAEAEGAAQEILRKKKKKKLIIIAAVALVVLLGGGVGGLVATGVIGGHKDKPAAEGGESGGTEGGDKAHAVKTDPVYFSLGDLIINLSTEGNRRLFLKVKISMEVSKPEEAVALEKMKPRIVDQFQIYLRELRMDDFRGSAGIDRLREELVLRTNAVTKPIKVRDVLFQEILVSQ